MVLFLVAHILSELTSSCNRGARLLEILIGDVRTLSTMQARRITKQEIAFAVQAVGTILANHRANVHNGYSSYRAFERAGDIAVIYLMAVFMVFTYVLNPRQLYMRQSFRKGFR